MNNQEVYIVSDDDEMYLGTVGELTGKDISSWKIGQGMSPAAAISDIVNGMISTGEIDVTKTFVIELRDPESM